MRLKSSDGKRLKMKLIILMLHKGPNEPQDIQLDSSKDEINVSWKSPHGFVDKIVVKLSKNENKVQVSTKTFAMKLLLRQLFFY